MLTQTIYPLYLKKKDFIINEKVTSRTHLLIGTDGRGCHGGITKDTPRSQFIVEVSNIVNK